MIVESNLTQNPKTKQKSPAKLKKSFKLSSVPSELINFVLILHVPLVTLVTSLLAMGEVSNNLTFGVLGFFSLTALVTRFFNLFNLKNQQKLEFFEDHFCLTQKAKNKGYCLKVDDIISLKLEHSHPKLPVSCHAINVHYSFNGLKNSIRLSGFNNQSDLYSVFQYLERQILTKQNRTKTKWI